MADLRVMSIMAHPDDFEFTAGGLFALLRKLRGPEVGMKILTTTRGASGHHEMGLEEPARRRTHCTRRHNRHDDRRSGCRSIR